MTCQGKIEYPMIASHELILAIAEAGHAHERLCEDCRRERFTVGCPAGVALRGAILEISRAQDWERESMASGLIGPHAVGPVLEGAK